RQVGVDVRLRLLPRNLEVLREPEGRDAVDDAEVDHLRDRAISGRELRGLLAEHLDGCRGVNVLASREGFTQLWLTGHVREDAQLDLRVVRRQQPMPRLGDECGANLLPELGPDR